MSGSETETEVTTEEWTRTVSVMKKKKKKVSVHREHKPIQFAQFIAVKLEIELNLCAKSFMLCDSIKTVASLMCNMESVNLRYIILFASTYTLVLSAICILLYVKMQLADYFNKRNLH